MQKFWTNRFSFVDIIVDDDIEQCEKFIVEFPHIEKIVSVR